MKITLQVLLIILPTLLKGQAIKENFAFIEVFASYQMRLTSQDTGDWSNYEGEKMEFDKKLRKLRTDKDSITEKFLNYLTQQEQRELEVILKKYSDLPGDNFNLKNELIDWKIDRTFFKRLETLNDIFLKLNYLESESKAVNNTPEEIVSIMAFESRLEEIVASINKLDELSNE